MPRDFPREVTHVTKLVDTLAGEGEKVGQGGFAIDEARAHEKMERYQLVDPLLYVLELVQAAHLLGATEIDLAIDADELEMTFDGDALRAKDLRNIASASFSRSKKRREQARRHLAVALTALGSLRPAEIRILMPRRRVGRGAELVRRDADIEVIEHDDLDPDLPISIYVREKFRFGHLVDFVTKRGGNLPEIHLLRDKCRYATVPIRVNGELVSQGLHLSKDVRHVEELKRRGEHGLVGVRPDRLGIEVANHVHLVQNGVWTWSAPLESDFMGVEAVYATKRLTRDLSHAAYVQDGDYQKLVHAVVPKAIYESMLEWVREVEVTFRNVDKLRALASRMWRHVATRDTSIELRVVAHALTRLPLWLDARLSRCDSPDDNLVSLQDLTPQAPDAPILYADASGVPHDSPVLLRELDQADAFEAMVAYTDRPWRSFAERLHRDAQPDEAEAAEPEREPPSSAEVDTNDTGPTALSEHTEHGQPVAEVEVEEDVEELDEDEVRALMLTQLQSGVDRALRNARLDIAFTCLTDAATDDTPQQVALVNGTSIAMVWDHPTARYALDAPGDPARAAMLLSATLTAVRERCADISVSDERAMQLQVLESPIP
jgi:hypothetical protein